MFAIGVRHGYTESKLSKIAKPKQDKSVSTLSFIEWSGKIDTETFKPRANILFERVVHEAD